MNIFYRASGRSRVLFLKILKSTNRKYKVYNFVESCQNVNYNIKYEILSHKTIAKIKKRNIIKI